MSEAVYFRCTKEHYGGGARLPSRCPQVIKGESCDGEIVELDAANRRKNIKEDDDK